MVTFYRKAQIKASEGSSAFDSLNTPARGGWNEPQYLGIINPEDELPYITVRPKTSRKNNKKVLRMRSHWD